MKFKHFLIVATVSTPNGVERLVDLNMSLEDVQKVSCIVSLDLNWSLYGYKKCGRCEWITDCRTLEGAINLYGSITGLQHQLENSQAVHIELPGEDAQIGLGIATQLAHQLEQMKDLFDDSDGAIANALDEFNKEKTRIMAASA